MFLEKFETKIGIEVHAQLSVRSKLFCSCPVEFEAPPNTNVCPICLGLPGVLPVLNEKAVDFAVIVACALNCRINEVSEFARKHYFYPDLPKGYQITQYKFPLAQDGWLQIGEKKIRIQRLHLEEETGKLIHMFGESCIDFNRCGIPLLEIVSYPDISSPKEAVEYLSELRLILEYTKVSSAQMEKGNFRCEPNVSVNTDKIVGVRTEIKNLNSMKAVEEAITQAIEWQKEKIAKGEEIEMTTMLWDEKTKKIRPMREKEEEADYRYFPEPDLPPLRIIPQRIERIKKGIPELPYQKRKRYKEKYGLKEREVEIFIKNIEASKYFEKVAEKCSNFETIASFIINDFMGIIREEGIEWSGVPIPPEDFGRLLKMMDEGKVSKIKVRDILKERLKGKRIPEVDTSLKIISPTKIKEAVDRVVKNHPEVVEKFKKGKESVIGFLIGQTMKELKRNGDPKLIKEELFNKLKEGKDG